MSGITGVTGVCGSILHTKRDTRYGYAPGSKGYLQRRQGRRSFNTPERPIVKKYTDADNVEHTEITL